MIERITILVVVLAAAPASADHDAMMMSGAPDSSFGAGISMVAARYDQTYFVGDYQGVTPTVDWMQGRYSAMAMVGFYRIIEDGRTLYGPGDLMMSATAVELDQDAWRGGITMAGTAPIGDQPTGFGMGHVMIMPSVWFARMIGSATVRADVGYNRALTNLADHDHGPWPIVDPMNMQELSWSASLTLPAWRKLLLAARATGGIPFDVAMGVDRVIGGLRATWADARMLTSFELQVGIAGDPFDVRGVVATEVRL